MASTYNRMRLLQKHGTALCPKCSGSVQMGLKPQPGCPKCKLTRERLEKIRKEGNGS